MAKKYSGRTGYHLQISRGLYVGKSLMRSIKFPIINANELIIEEIASQLRNDYLSQVGNIQLTSYINKTIYKSLFDLYIEMLRQGFIFASSIAELRTKVNKLTNQQTPFEKIRGELKKEIIELMHEDLFEKEVFLKSQIRANPRLKYEKLFKKGIDESIKAEYVAKMLAGVWNAEKGTAKSVNERSEFWEEFIGLRKQVESSDTKVKTSTLTCYPLPMFHFEEKQIQEIVNEYNRYFYGNNERLEGLTDDEFNKMIWEKVRDLMGLSNSFNAFSNLFLTVVPQLADPEHRKELFTEILEYADVWDNNKEDLRGRLNKVGEIAERINAPQMVSNWSEYRSSFGGKIQSWVSNYLRQMEDLKKRLQGQLEEFHRLKEKFDIDILQVTAANEKLLNDNSNAEFHKIYEDLVADLKAKLNIQRQERGIDHKQFAKDYPEIHRNIPKINKFIGESKASQYQNFLQTCVRLNEGMGFLKKLYNFLDSQPKETSEEEAIRRYLNSLKRFYKTSRNSLYARKLKQFFLSIGVSDEELEDEQKRFFIPIQSQDTRLSLIYLKVTLKDIQKKATQLPLSFTWKEHSLDYLFDHIEFLKIQTAFLLNLTSNISFTINQNEIKTFLSGVSYLTIFGNQFDKEKLSFFTQRYIFAELRGALNVLSQDTHIERYVIQALGGEKKFPLAFIPKNSQTDNAIQLQNRKEWAFIIPTKGHGDSEITLFTQSNKDYSSPNKMFKRDTVNTSSVFPIRTSKYQIQFLDNPLGAKNSFWNNIKLNLGEQSIIVEDRIARTWDREKMTPTIKKVSTKLFISLPISIDLIDAEKQKNYIEPQRFLGIDVGEYGLAYTIFQPEPTFKILKQGFIYEESLRKIRESVAKNKQKQIAGTFSAPSTAIARMRQQAITSIRNRVHDLVIRYKAKPVYEYEISNFETKSGRVTKVYNSLKRSDLYAETDADKAVQKLIWGSSKLIGQSIGAWATSTLCSNCFKSYLVETEGKEEEIFYIEEKDGRSVARLNNEYATIFVSNKKTGSLTQKEVKNAIHNFMRPPYKDGKAQHLSNLEIPNNFEKYRGNSAIFVCPFCRAISDADIQASLFIGLKGYLKSKTKEKKVDEESDLKAKLQKTMAVIQWAKENGVAHVPFKGITGKGE